MVARLRRAVAMELFAMYHLVAGILGLKEARNGYVRFGEATPAAEEAA